MNKTFKSALKEYGVLDLSTEFSNWAWFVYMFIPNNWLKMHGYPKRRRTK